MTERLPCGGDPRNHPHERCGIHCPECGADKKSSNEPLAQATDVICDGCMEALSAGLCMRCKEEPHLARTTMCAECWRASQIRQEERLNERRPTHH